MDNKYELVHIMRRPARTLEEKDDTLRELNIFICNAEKTPEERCMALKYFDTILGTPFADKDYSMADVLMFVCDCGSRYLN